MVVGNRRAIKSLRRFNRKNIKNTERRKYSYKRLHELIIRLKKDNSSTSGNEDYSKLEQLKRLKDKDVITQREFDLKKKQILGV